MRIRDIILPEDQFFLEIFREISEKIVMASSHLTELISDLDQHRGITCQKIHQLEHESDELLRKIFARLEESLITPLEPDEIHRLAKALDDVIDIIDWVAHQICNYQLSGTYPPNKGERLPFPALLGTGRDTFASSSSSLPLPYMGDR